MFMWQYYVTLLHREQCRTETVSQPCRKSTFPVQRNSIL